MTVPTFSWDFTAPPSGRRRRRWPPILLALSLALALPLAFADPTDEVRFNLLGNEATVVTSCVTDGVGISFKYGYSAAAAGYVVTEAVITDIPASCHGRSVKVHLANHDFTLAAEDQAVFDAAGGANDTAVVRFHLDQPSAEAITNAAVVIEGLSPSDA